MAKKKHKKKKPQTAAEKKTLMNKAERYAEQNYRFHKGVLGKGEMLVLIVACMMLLCSFVLSVSGYTFPYKQPIVFLMMGLGCLVVAYLQSKSMRMKEKNAKTPLFWMMAILGGIYTFAAIYTFFIPVA